jgi:dsDNA-binding SOS-regulon protein
MTTTKSYNPILRAIRELTTPQARRWYWQQLQTTATLAQTLTRRSLATTRHLLDASKPALIAAVAEPEQAVINATAPVEAPANGLVPEAISPSGAVQESDQEIALAHVAAVAAALAYEHTPPAWVATEVNESETSSSEDEGLEEALECCPPFVEEQEDTSFFLAEDDEDIDRLLYNDTEPHPSSVNDSADEAAAFAWEEHQIVSDRTAGE